MDLIELSSEVVDGAAEVFVPDERRVRTNGLLLEHEPVQEGVLESIL
jgi:hypothetical protein